MSDTGSPHHQSQAEAPGPAPQPGDVLALSNISQKDIAPGASNAAMVKALYENCSMLSQVLVSTHQKVGRMETTMDNIGDRLGKLEKRQQVDGSPYAKLFECEENKMVSSTCKQAPRNFARAVRSS